MFPIYCVNGSATFPGFARGSPSVGFHTPCFLGSDSSWPSQAFATIEIWNFATTEMWDNTGPLPLADDVRQKGCWTGVLGSSKFPLCGGLVKAYEETVYGNLHPGGAMMKVKRLQNLSALPWRCYRVLVRQGLENGNAQRSVLTRHLAQLLAGP